MNDIQHIDRPSSAYPPNVERYLGDSAPATVTAIGNLDILQNRMVALFCSQSCPGDLASGAYDVAQQLRDAGTTVVGGFHSPMEGECLKVLLCSPHPVIIGYARALDGARTAAEYERPLKEGRLLLLSRFGPDINRVTVDTARIRNHFMAALADRVFVAHAGPGSKTEEFCRTVLAWGKPLFTLDSPRNERILAEGAAPLEPADAKTVLGLV